MERELLRTLFSIKDKTGIDVTVVSESGLHYASTRAEYDVIPLKIFHGETVAQDEADNATYFRFIYGGNKFAGKIAGVTVCEKNYANLIASYIESSQTKNVELSYDEQLSLIVTGNSTKSRTVHFMNKYSVSKNSAFAMIIKCESGKANEVCDFLKNYSGSVADTSVVVSQDACAYVKFVEFDDAQEYSSPAKTAELLQRSLYEELGFNTLIYVGGVVKSFTEISVSFNQALVAEKMSALFSVNGATINYKDFVLAKMAEDVSHVKIEEYLSALLGENGKELLKDDELLTTGDAFLNSNLNVSETARELYIHRNTLIYRLDKIEKLTGLDIRKFGDALNFRLISVLVKLKG